MKTTKQKKAEVTIATTHAKFDKRSIEKLIRDLVSSIIDEFGRNRRSVTGLTPT